MPMQLACQKSKLKWSVPFLCKNLELDFQPAKQVSTLVTTSCVFHLVLRVIMCFFAA